MARSVDFAAQRRKLLGDITRLQRSPFFGKPYRNLPAPADKRAGHCQGDGPKHGPHLNVSYRGKKGKTTLLCTEGSAKRPTREGVAAWAKKCRMSTRTGGAK